MDGDQTATNTTDTTNDLLSYPTIEEEVAAVPTQQVGFVPPKELEVKSKPIQSVATDAEKQQVKLEALMKQQIAKEESPAPAVETQPVAPTTAETATTSIVEATPEPTATESIIEPQTESITASEQRGQELAALAQTETTQAPDKQTVTTPEPIIPPVKETQPKPVSEQVPAEPEPIPELQTPLATTTDQIRQELPKLPFAEVEEEPITTAPTSTATLGERITTLEMKIDTLIAKVNKWV